MAREGKADIPREKHQPLRNDLALWDLTWHMLQSLVFSYVLWQVTCQNWESTKIIHMCEETCYYL